MSWEVSPPSLAGSDEYSFRQWLWSLWRHVNYTTAIKSVSDAYTAKPDDGIILVDTSGGAVTVTLPLASGLKTKVFTIKKNTSSANNITIARSGSDTIDGATSKTVSGTSYEYTRLVSDGSNWWSV